MTRLTRRRLLHMTAAALSAPFAVADAALAGTVRDDSAFGSRLLRHPVHYSLYLPPGYSSDARRYPVLYLLHGAGDGQPADWFRLAGVDLVLDRLIESGEVPPLIAVAPDGRRGSEDPRATYFLNDADGRYRWADMFIEEFIPHVESRYRTIIDAGSRTLMGISMGGFAAVLYQLRHPGLFGGISALSAALRTVDQLMSMGQDDYDLRFGAAFGAGLTGRARLNTFWESSNILKVIEQTDRRRFTRWPRIYLMLAAEDPFFAGNAAVHIALNNAGIQHRFVVGEGKHDWVYWRHAIPDAIRHLGAVISRQYGE